MKSIDTMQWFAHNGHKKLHYNTLSLIHYSLQERKWTQSNLTQRKNTWSHIIIDSSQFTRRKIALSDTVIERQMRWERFSQKNRKKTLIKLKMYFSKVKLYHEQGKMDSYEVPKSPGN